MAGSSQTGGKRNRTRPQERFDVNRVVVTGKVTKIWSRDNGTVYARIELPAVDGQPPTRSTVVFPNGQVNGAPITLMAGDHIKVIGYATDISYAETLVNMSERVHFEGKPLSGSLFDDDKLPELKNHGKLFVYRNMMGVVPEVMEHDPKEECNTIAVDGIVLKISEHTNSGQKSTDLIIRMAVYDSHTEVIGPAGPKGVRRKPHYLTVRIADSMVDGRKVNVQKKGSEIGLQPKDRIRISGRLDESVYYSDVHRWLVEAKAAELIAKLPNADRLSQYYVMVSGSVAVAEKMIGFTDRG